MEIEVTLENLEGLLSSRQSIFSGLASLGPRRAEGAYQMGLSAARILKGEKPADLPVRQIASSELMINPGVARSLRLRISSALLACADEVIE